MRYIVVLHLEFSNLVRRNGCRIMQFLQKFGVEENDVHSALLSSDPYDQLSIAYHLIVDNKRFASEETAERLNIKDLIISSPPGASASASSAGSSGLACLAIGAWF